jgi:GT2 family glycosyltransferase
VYAHEAVAFHRGSGTGRYHSAFHAYHLRRNIEYLFWVDMVGALAWRYLLPHLIYEAAAYAAALGRGQGGCVIRAKWDALRRVGWIVRQRRRLAQDLRQRGLVASGKRRLAAGLTPSWRLPCKREVREVGRAR